MALQTFTAGQILTAAQVTALQANDYNQTVSAKTGSYVLTAADKGTRITMSSASATTITVNTSLFAAGDSLRIQNLNGGGVCTVTAGTATVTSAGSLAIPSWGGGQLYFTSASAAVWFPDAVTATASGFVVTKAETAFTTASTVEIDNAFSATYTNYKIFIRYQTSSTGDIYSRFRVGGVSASGANYNSQLVSGNGSTASAFRETSQTSMYIGDDSNGAFFSSLELSIYAPFAAEPTIATCINNRSNGNYTSSVSQLFATNHTVATSYDGFQLIVASGTITGTYTVYGMGKTV